MPELKRPIQQMPTFVKDALQEAGLVEQYDSRPPYQRNDYLWWINSAKRDDTKQKRLSKMMTELKAGSSYMGMDWRPKS
ncbi:YdeI/OmpD-associated family protein [uncultured Ruegeria sp.]|uniref:YdeI/OmpD-associated family protein n=1 Tax=uncultured Ruegeria sp. TaxID=259304 RepID=UPI002630ECA1|nr:YdeI/OmpD-associated family protein [uncultured Ruegeria sp.]